MTPEQHIDIYLMEWVEGLKISREPKDEFLERMRDMVTLNGQLGGGNYVSPKGYHHLNSAAELLLLRLKEQRRLTQRTARNALIDSHFSLLEKARQTGKLSEFAVVARASSQLAVAPRHDGLYVLPVMFAPAAKNSCFQVGPVTLVAKERFQAEHGEAIQGLARGDKFDRRFVAEWRLYTRRYDHFLTVNIEGHEDEMAWSAAHEAAEYMLNLIRMRFGYYHTRNIKRGGGYVQEQFSSKIVVTKGGDIGFTSQGGPWGSHLDDEWMTHLDEALGDFAGLLSDLGSWLASGDDPASPILERLRYANGLMSEAYSEPHDHIRLVRLIAALEAMALLPREEKAENLARRCSIVGNWDDSELEKDIFAAVKEAYRLRNAVVHGDAPTATAVMEAFLGLERHLLAIYIGFLRFHASIHNTCRPQSIKHLRRLASHHIQNWSASAGFQ